MTVTLRNNTTAEQVSTILIASNLKTLNKESPFTFWHLAMKCNDASHKIFNPAIDLVKNLQDLSLLDKNGGIIENIKNIVLSMVENMPQPGSSYISPLKLINPILIKATPDPIPDPTPNKGMCQYCIIQ